jgi:pimeloyl-ACP methyl ester carboxylesterase
LDIFKPPGALPSITNLNAMTVPTSQFITAPDGLKLHVRLYGERSSDRLPVVCLPGLSRTVADFDALATSLAADEPQSRHVIAIDYRGRGLSDYDPNPANYSLPVELTDVLTILTELEIGPAVIVGTSRGGILAMLLGAAHPAAVAGVVLNDIGPVVELPGLLRIKSYVGKLPQAGSFDEGAELLRGLFGAQFPRLSTGDWMAFAKRSFKEHEGILLPTYDVKLAQTLDGIDPNHPLPPMWEAFDTLARVPVMVIRGVNSDVLAADTVIAMRARRPDLVVVEVPDQGHAPLLVEDDVIRRIESFVSDCDNRHHA